MPTPTPAEVPIEDVAPFHHDPAAFVAWAYPWREPGALAEHGGPRPWQRDALDRIGAALQAGSGRGCMVRMATASGHGIGKSALVAWLVDWATSTSVDCRGLVTANTEAQLRTKTWPELAKWHRMSLTRGWFKHTATAYHATDSEHERTWRIDALPWSETRPEAFAGLHNEGRRILIVMDEASAIPDLIWEVLEGALTDETAEIVWLAFGNPTRNTGRFRECFGRMAHRWKTAQIDSRTVPGTNAFQIAQWVEDYGEDSDFVRVRVRGVFPRAGSMQFIGSDLIESAIAAEATALKYDPLILGVDVARYGDDRSVAWYRRGRDAKTIPAKTWRGISLMDLAGEIAGLMEHPIDAGHRIDHVLIDETGIGGGVVDRIRQLGLQCLAVNFGGKAEALVDGVECRNKRSEMWARMKCWLQSGGAIPDDADLRVDLEGPEYGYDALNRIELERKDDMKRRGLSSPDMADALALTFAYPFGPTAGLLAGTATATGTAMTEYNPLEG